MIDPRFPGLSNAIVNSGLWSAGATVADAVNRAWLHSATARLATSLRSALHLSMLAWIGVFAGVMALAAQFAVPVYVRPGLPIIWPIAAIIGLAFVARSAPALERAWPHSAIARWLAPPQLR